MSLGRATIRLSLAASVLCVFKGHAIAFEIVCANSQHLDMFSLIQQILLDGRVVQPQSPQTFEIKFHEVFNLPHRRYELEELPEAAVDMTGEIEFYFVEEVCELELRA